VKKTKTEKPEMNNIKKRLEELCKSQGWLACVSGINRQMISKIANGRTRDPRIQTAMKIAQALHCSIEDLWTLPKS
jgi:DNA-binding XRE family transcriptional regulator